MLIPLEKLIQDYNLKIQGIIHIGAHELQELAWYNQAGIKNENIYWFDANAELVEQMKIKHPTSHINYVVASDVDNRKVDYIITNSSQSNSIYELDVHKTEYAWCHEVGRIPVTTTRLDTWFEKTKIDYSKLNAVFCDCQGADLDVIKGLGNMILDIDYIYTEINFAHMYRNCALADEMDTYLKQFGFHRVVTQLASDNWGDCLYIRDYVSTPKKLSVHCISLQREIKRKQHMRKQSIQHNLNINFFNAISGCDIDVLATKHENLALVKYAHTESIYEMQHRVKKLSYGEIGCLFSHIALLEQLISSALDYYFIMEDDAQILQTDNIILQQQLSNVVNQNNDWDFCLMTNACTWYPPVITTQYKSTSFFNIEKKCFNMMNGYIVSKSGAVKILQHVKCADANYRYLLSVPFDNIVSDLFIANKLG